jgi:hypothetical protein
MRPRAGRMPREARWCRSAHETQEHGLGLIVARVRDGNAIGATAIGRSLEKLVARGACRGFDRASPGLRERGHIHVADVDRHAKPGGQRSTEGGVLVGLRPDPMVQMRDPGEDDIPARGEFPQQEQQGDRVGSSGNRGQHTRTRVPQPVTRDRLPETIEWNGHGPVHHCCVRRRATPGEACRRRSVRTKGRGAGGRTRTADLALMRRSL